MKCQLLFELILFHYNFKKANNIKFSLPAKDVIPVNKALGMLIKFHCNRSSCCNAFLVFP